MVQDELNIENFNPKKAELQEMAQKYSNLSIKGIHDVEGYRAVDVARKELKKTRVEITKTGKMLRSNALAFQKKVIETEKELINLIEPIEVDLESKQQEIDTKKAQQKRIDSLPFRRERLAEVEEVLADEFILTMDDTQFYDYIMAAKEKQLAKKDADMKLREEAIQKEQERLVSEAKIAAAQKLAREEAEKETERRLEQAKKQAEEDKRIAIEQEKQNSEREKRLIIEAQEKKEREAKQAEELEKQRIESEKLAKEEADRKLNAKSKFRQFIIDNGCDPDDDRTFVITKTDKEVFLYKYMASYQL